MWGILPPSHGYGARELNWRETGGFWERWHRLPGEGVGTTDPCSGAGSDDSGHAGERSRHTVPGSKGDHLFLGSVCGNLEAAGGSVEINLSPSIQQHYEFLNVERRT